MKTTQRYTWAGIESWFHCLVDLQHELVGRGGCPLVSLASALVEQDDIARAELITAFSTWEGHLLDGLTAMRDPGVLREDADASELTTATMASVQGGLLLTQVRRDPRQLRTALDAALDHLRSFETV